MRKRQFNIMNKKKELINNVVLRPLELVQSQPALFQQTHLRFCSLSLQKCNTVFIRDQSSGEYNFLVYNCMYTQLLAAESSILHRNAFLI